MAKRSKKKETDQEKGREVKPTFAIYELTREQLGEELAPFEASVYEQLGLMQTEEMKIKRAGILQPYVDPASPPAKRDRVAMFLRLLERDEQFWKKEAERMRARADRCRSLIKEALFSVGLLMEQYGIVKAEGEVFAFARRKNPPSCKVFDPQNVPEEYLRKSDALELVEALIPWIEDVKKSQEKGSTTVPVLDLSAVEAIARRVQQKEKAAPDKRKILEDLKEKKEIEGAVLAEESYRTEIL